MKGDYKQIKVDHSDVEFHQEVTKNLMSLSLLECHLDFSLDNFSRVEQFMYTLVLETCENFDSLHWCLALVQSRQNTHTPM